MYRFTLATRALLSKWMHKGRHERCSYHQCHFCPKSLLILKAERQTEFQFPSPAVNAEEHWIIQELTCLHLLGAILRHNQDICFRRVQVAPEEVPSLFCMYYRLSE